MDDFDGMKDFDKQFKSAWRMWLVINIIQVLFGLALFGVSVYLILFAFTHWLKW